MKNISNMRFGKLTAIEPTGQKRGGARVWSCICDCGNKTEARVNSLTAGLTRSCGCMKSESARARKGSHGMRLSGAYKSWDSMIQRCTNKNSASYRNYGAAGIAICPEWRSFAKFHEDMGDRPVGMSLDRINPLLGYSKENCRWATALQQSRNKRSPTLQFELAQRIRAMYLMGYPTKAIQRELGVTRGQVNGVIYLGQVWQEG